MAYELIEKILKEFDDQSGDFAILVNGMGGTPLMEQYIFANDVLKELADKKVAVKFSKVGNLVTSLDMQGFSLTIMKADSSWIDYLKEPVTTIAW